jgi:hypothetical protein
VSASAHEGYDFELVPILELMLRVAGLGDQFEIDFDGHGLAFEPELLKQPGDGHLAGNLARLAVDGKSHVVIR